MQKMVALKDIVRVLRSKNSGPFEVTFDIIFDSREDFDHVMGTGVLNEQLVSKLYHVPVEQICTFCAYPAANALKITIPRAASQASIGETDMHAAQQHVPLMYVMIPM
jgi:hypothetical protein